MNNSAHDRLRRALSGNRKPQPPDGGATTPSTNPFGDKTFEDSVTNIYQPGDTGLRSHMSDGQFLHHVSDTRAVEKVTRKAQKTVDSWGQPLDVTIGDDGLATVARKGTRPHKVAPPEKDPTPVSRRPRTTRRSDSSTSTTHGGSSARAHNASRSAAAPTGMDPRIAEEVMNGNASLADISRLLRQNPRRPVSAGAAAGAGAFASASAGAEEAAENSSGHAGKTDRAFNSSGATNSLEQSANAQTNPRSIRPRRSVDPGSGNSGAGAPGGAAASPLTLSANATTSSLAGADAVSNKVFGIFSPAQAVVASVAGVVVVSVLAMMSIMGGGTATTIGAMSSVSTGQHANLCVNKDPRKKHSDIDVAAFGEHMQLLDNDEVQLAPGGTVKAPFAGTVAEIGPDSITLFSSGTSGRKADGSEADSSNREETESLTWPVPNAVDSMREEHSAAKGVTFDKPAKSPIYAYADGEVIHAGPDGEMQFAVMIRSVINSTVVVTKYGFTGRDPMTPENKALNQEEKGIELDPVGIFVTVGEKVKAGHHIADVGTKERLLTPDEKVRVKMYRGGPPADGGEAIDFYEYLTPEVDPAPGSSSKEWTEDGIETEGDEFKSMTAKIPAVKMEIKGVVIRQDLKEGDSVDIGDTLGSLSTDKDTFIAHTWVDDKPKDTKEFMTRAMEKSSKNSAVEEEDGSAKGLYEDGEGVDIVGGSGAIGLAKGQVDNAKIIMAVAYQLGVSEEGIKAALDVAQQESGLWNYSNERSKAYSPMAPSNNAVSNAYLFSSTRDPRSQRQGGDGNSTGLFQQQVKLDGNGEPTPDQPWGRWEQSMDPAYATWKFFDAGRKRFGEEWRHQARGTYYGIQGSIDDARPASRINASNEIFDALFTEAKGMDFKDDIDSFASDTGDAGLDSGAGSGVPDSLKNGGSRAGAKRCKSNSRSSGGQLHINADTLAESLVETARTQIGKPYSQRAGERSMLDQEDPSHQDCSSLVSWAYFWGAGMWPSSPGSTWPANTVAWEYLPTKEMIIKEYVSVASVDYEKDLKPADVINVGVPGKTHHMYMYVGENREIAAHWYDTPLSEQPGWHTDAQGGPISVYRPLNADNPDVMVPVPDAYRNLISSDIQRMWEDGKKW